VPASLNLRTRIRSPTEHYERHDRLKAHLTAFVDAYNFAKRLKTVKGLTPYGFVTARWTDKPEHFTLNPRQHFPGLNT